MFEAEGYGSIKNQKGRSNFEGVDLHTTVSCNRVRVRVRNLPTTRLPSGQLELMILSIGKDSVKNWQPGINDYYPKDK